MATPRPGLGHSRCLQGGQGKPLGAMSGPSSLGWRCVKVDVATGGSQGRKVRHAGGSYRPIILTVPALVRPTCSHNAAVLLGALRRGGAPGLEDLSRDGRSQALRGG